MFNSMNKLLLLTICLFTSVLVSAGPKPKKQETWIDASVKAKSELRTQLQKQVCLLFPAG